MRAAAARPKDKPKNQLWPSFFKSLVLPVIVLGLFAFAPHWLNEKLRSQIIKNINDSTRLTQDQKNDRLATFSKIDFAAVSRDAPPEYADLRDLLEKSGVTDTYAHLRWAFACSIALVAVLLLTSAVLLVLNQSAKKSQDALIRCYRLSWKIAMTSAVIQVLLLVPLMTFAVYEFPVIWSDHWYPKFVIVVLILGVVTLWRSIAILLHNVPLRFNELFSRRITPEQAPELWQAVRAAAERLHTAPPDNILIGLQLNFYVTELAVWDGHELAQGRTLYLSYPLLKSLPEEEVLAIIGHELGHFIGEDTRMTREFYPLRLKAHATVVALAQATYVGWTSLQFMNFFGWSFGETEQLVSRKRELLADEKGAELTSREIAARALVRFHVLSEAFHQGFLDAVRSDNRDPLDVQLHIVVREKLSATAAFWSELFEKKLPHPLDSHPALHFRLEALGQPMAPQAAEALATQEVVSAYSRWFTGREEIFADLRKDADEVMQKLRTRAKIVDASYDSEEGRKLLETHFPEKRWPRSPGRIWFALMVLTVAAVGCWLVTLLVDTPDTMPLRVGFAIGSLLPVWCAVVIWKRHYGAQITLKADSINYTGWLRPISFKDLERVSGRNVNSVITIYFHLKQPQPPIWKYSLLRRPRKTVSLSLSGLANVKQPKAAEEIFRYFTRQIPE